MSLIDELERLNALHRSGGLSTEEFQKAKAKLLGSETPLPLPLPAPVTGANSPGRRMELEAELARVDREFEMIRQECLVRGHRGGSYEPTEGGGAVTGLFFLLWLGAAIFITFQFAEHEGAFALFPLGIAVAGTIAMVTSASTSRRKLTRLTAARARWQEARAEILARINALGP